jgi:hypothetical protein
LHDLSRWQRPLAGRAQGAQFSHRHRSQRRQRLPHYDKAKGKLYYDPDGDGDQGKGLIATFDNKATLTASDIKVIAFTNFDDFWA